MDGAGPDGLMINGKSADYMGVTGALKYRVQLKAISEGGKVTVHDAEMTADMTFDTLGIADYAANSAKWDEIRWGTSFNDVTTAPIPEPSATILGGLGMLALLRRRRTSVSVIR